jgi:ammonium transporter, Amt family
MSETLHRWGLATLLLAALVGTMTVPSAAWAQDEVAAAEATTSDSAAAAPADMGVGYALDNSMLFITGILVMWMQAGFAMVETGFNASKNAVNILFKNTMDFCIGALLFYTIGFAMMYPGNYGIDVEANKYFAWGGFGLYEGAADRSLSPEVDWLFQCMFAATAATIVSGAVAGRIKLGAYFIYSAVISGLIYPVSGFWKWGGGWLNQMGFADFAGSCVVHGVGGFAGLAGAILLGPRIGRFVNGKSVPSPGHSLPLACLGVFILWLGWYGFNPGSQLAFQSTSDIDIVMHCAVTTTLAAAAGGCTGTFLSWILFGKPDLSIALNGILGGLVGITANCDCVTNPTAMLIGVIAGVLVICGMMLLDKLQIDDPVGAWPVHGLCGMWGCMAIGILPNVYTSAAVAQELRGIAPADFTPSTSFVTQLTGTVAICGWSFVTMFILFSILKAVGYFRAGEEEEQKGLDISEHGMQAYQQ